MTERISEKIESLVRRLRSLESAVVAFSGGVDSTLLLVCARTALGVHAVAVTAASPSYPDHELGAAREFCEGRGIEHLVVETDELADPRYAANPPDRCYYCKRALIRRFLEVADGRGLRYMIEGTNASDLGGHRPGHGAARECERVVMPLVEENFTKDDVRAALRELGVDAWEMPSAACLASRVPSGTPITEELLRRIGDAEKVVRAMGPTQVRVRHHGEIARIEVEAKDAGFVVERRAEIARALRGLGWKFVALDLDGYRTGSISG